MVIIKAKDGKVLRTDFTRETVENMKKLCCSLGQCLSGANENGGTDVVNLKDIVEISESDEE